MRVASILSFLAAVGLSGCVNAMDETAFAKRRAAISSDPAAFRSEVDDCVVASRAKPQLMEFHMQLTGEPQGRATQLACERVTEAMKQGRYDYPKYSAIFRGSFDPELVKIMQGR